MIHFDRFKAKIDNILSATIFMRTLGGGNTMEGLIWETSEELDKKIAARLRLIRKRRSISQQQLAKMSNVSYGSIKRFETTGQISLLSLTKIATALQVADELRNLLTGILRRLLMSQNKYLHVLYHNIPVGTLAMAQSRLVAFEYTEDWLKNGFSISPFSLPLRKEVFLPSKYYFQGLWGVFADSLPDAWGRLLLERLLKAQGKNPDLLTVLDRLAIVGTSGMGALTYEPEEEWAATPDYLDLDDLAYQCKKILNTEYSDKLDELFSLGGTSGGARPKILTEINNEPWIIKFPASNEGENAGFME